MAQQGGSATNSFGAPGGGGDQAAVAAACAAAAAAAQQQLGGGAPGGAAPYCGSPNAAVGGSFGSGEPPQNTALLTLPRTCCRPTCPCFASSGSRQADPTCRPTPMPLHRPVPSRPAAASPRSPLCGLLPHQLGRPVHPEPARQRLSGWQRLWQAQRRAPRPAAHVHLARRHCLLRGRQGGGRRRVSRRPSAGWRRSAHPPHLGRVHSQRAQRRGGAVGAGAGGRAAGSVSCPVPSGGGQGRLMNGSPCPARRGLDSQAAIPLTRLGRPSTGLSKRLFGAP